MKSISATSAREIHCRVASSKTASVYSMVCQAASLMEVMAFLTVASRRRVTDTSAPALMAVTMVARP
ncbi:hypothetical protein HEB94_003818 [Actinopolymorpha pittospori]|uniref:Uncharacterized protein n=1 Tax=Actinopolymorpha pittospori TaxID=648752 RepID=A0A927N1H9_9ACTN|nr:hypothetical protein [Actinopolymorpha pittospori]